jgi:hypothetical protein
MENDGYGTIRSLSLFRMYDLTCGSSFIHSIVIKHDLSVFSQLSNIKSINAFEYLHSRRSIVASRCALDLQKYIWLGQDFI